MESFRMSGGGEIGDPSKLELALSQVVDVLEKVVALPAQRFTKLPYRSVLIGYLYHAGISIQANDLEAADMMLNWAAWGMDGCALRGSPDGWRTVQEESGIDWIKDCVDQKALHAIVSSVQELLSR